jgi:hypothetical protein
MKTMRRFVGRVSLPHLLFGVWILAFSSEAFSNDGEPLLSKVSQILKENKWEIATLDSGNLRMLTAQKVFPTSRATIKLSVIINSNTGRKTWAQLHDYANQGVKMLRSKVATVKSDRLDLFTHQVKVEGGEDLGILISMLTTKEHPQLYIQVQVPLAKSQNRIMRELAEINDIMVRFAAEVGYKTDNIIVFDDGMVQLQRGGVGIVFDPTQMGKGE